MERSRKILALIGLAYGLMACREAENDPPVKSEYSSFNRPVLNPGEREIIHLKQVKRVVCGRNILGDPTVSIVVGSNSRNYFDLTLLRSNIKMGYSVNSENFSHPEILLSTHWHGSRFLQSDQHRTAVSLTIGSITSREAVLYLSATLVNPQTGGYLTLSPSIITVQGADLKKLVAEQ